MKIAVVYNSLEGCVMQHRGPKVHEIYPLHNVQRIVDALHSLNHEVIVLEGDTELFNRLQDFFSQIPDDIRLGLVFNLSFGMQGQIRYCQIPVMFDMLGFLILVQVLEVIHYPRTRRLSRRCLNMED